MAGPSQFGSPTPVVITDGSGAVISTGGNPPGSIVGTQVTTITNSTGETTIVSAGGTGVFNDIYGLQITNASATAVTVTIKDATSGTTRKIYDLAANGGIVVSFLNGLPQSTAANNWTVTLSVNTVTVDVNVDFIASKVSV